MDVATPSFSPPLEDAPIRWRPYVFPKYRASALGVFLSSDYVKRRSSITGAVIPSNPYCLSFQDKIRLLQDDLESERELRQRVSSTNVYLSNLIPHELLNTLNALADIEICRDSKIESISDKISFEIPELRLIKLISQKCFHIA